MKGITIRTLALPVLLAAALSPVCQAQAQLAGDWQGTLSAGGVALRLVLHIAAGKDGVLTATLDSVDQGAYAIPVNAIALNGSKLSLTVDAVHGTYEGTVSKDAGEIDGTWSQGQPLELDFKRVPASAATAQAAPNPAPPSDIDGTWTGSLDANGTTLRILFKIVTTADGLAAKMQSPDQSPIWISATAVRRDGSVLTIEVKGIGAVFEGKISGDRTSIDGTFTQGVTLPLLLQHAKE